MLVIVPDFPPNIDGLGDYAYLLANQLRENGYVYEINFIVAGNLSYSFTEHDGFSIRTLKKQKADSLFHLLEKINTNFIHLHYVSYGYAKRGTPVWLYLGLKKWKQRKENVLITTFHESYATSTRPWTSSFWNQWLQKLLCKRIMQLSDHAIANRLANGEILKRFSPQKNITILPVFSNMGEPVSITPLIQRKKQMVVLGSAANRKYTYAKYSNEINMICKKLSIEQIIDIGIAIDIMPEFNIPLIQKGPMARNEISNILSESYVGLMGAYGAEYFARSGVFAAYTSHAMLVIALNVNISRKEDGLIVNKHFVTQDLSDEDFSLISRSGYEWYSQHNIKSQTEAYQKIFQVFLV